ncbi:OTU-like cysteine protease [Trifolium pratense]|uniref:OTU-like cysteine protease n=1 Tax=Trifolium pratense TaxID=57577 RepID=A0A2K3LXK9_TRIPR|nr:OTU-like cysteine protease [Trifolium pratense]
MPKFMHSYIEGIIDVEGDSNCGYRVIALDSRNNENDFEAIKVDMINELRLHMDDYLKLYGGEERLAYVREALLPPKRKSRHGVVLMEKWLTFPDMGHIVASILGRVVVKLTKHGASETFFSLRGIPPADPSSHIL